MLVVGCSPNEGSSSSKTQALKRPPAKPYVPKPGETVVKFTFETTTDPVLGNGDVYIRLLTEDAPMTCAHILDLVRKGFYKGILVHRVMTELNFKITQFGNAATKDGTIDQNRPEVGSGVSVPREPNKHKHVAGAVALARSDDPNGGDSQLYICFVDIPHLDAGYTVFGEVAQGLDVAEGLGKGSKVMDCSVVQDAKAVGAGGDKKK